MATSAACGPASYCSSNSVHHVLHQASELNEDGIYELASGRSSKAIAHFQKASKILTQTMEVLLQRRHTSNDVAATTSVSHSTYRVQIPHLHDDLFYIYSCVVSYNTLPPTSSPTQAQVMFELATVFFNTALAYHQQGKKISTGGEASLSQALSYYSECQRLLNSLPPSSTTEDSNSDDDVLLMTLAVMNNQAHILYQNTTTACNHPEVFHNLWQYSMHAILMADDKNLSMVEQSQIHEFVQNAMVFRSLQRPCVAPTA